MTDPNRVREGYDDLAADYAAARDPDGAAEPLGRFRAELPAEPRVLDAGCGQGTPVLASLGGRAETVGLDVSRGQLDLARGTAPDAALLQGEMTALPLADDTVDGVTALHSLVHVPRPEHPTAIAEFARVLRPGGTLLVTEGPEEWTGHNPDWLDSGVGMEWSVAGPEATREALAAAGFDLREEWTVADDLADDGGSDPYFLATLSP